MVDIRPITENELDAFVDLMDVAYLQDSDKDRRDRYRKINELDRSFGAFDGDQLVGTISAFSFEVAAIVGDSPPNKACWKCGASAR